MSEPVKVVALNPIIDEVFPDARWERNTFSVRAVLPERTFLEKTPKLLKLFNHGHFIHPKSNILNKTL